MKTRSSFLGVSLFLIAAGSLLVSTPSAFANKVDCGKVMSEVGAGKKAGAVAKDLNISTSSVYRCKKKAGSGKGTTVSSKNGPAVAAFPASH